MGNDTSDDDRRLEAWLADAPRVAPSTGFRDRVMRALEPRRPWRASVARFLFSAHTLRWNVAGLAAAGALVAIVVALGWQLQEPLRPGTETAQTVTVRFVLNRPDASAVRLAGNFTGWQARLPLVRQADGSWRAEIQLPPGEYEYAFVVNDNQWIQDPAATRFRNDGFGGHNAVLLVPGSRQDRYAG
jgi:Glycogen recognition site of AMP-activated protein kinase